MNNKKLVWLLGAEAVLCLVLCLIQPFDLTGIMGFPFAPIAKGLRALSLLSDAGNVVAWVIFWVLGLLPLVGMWLLRKKRVKADWLLAFFAVFLVLSLYEMINPGWLLSSLVIEEMAPLMLNSTLWTTLLAWLVLRFADALKDAGVTKSLKWMDILCCLMCICLVFCIFGTDFSGLLTSFDNVRAGNTMGGISFTGTFAVMTLKYILDCVPLVLNIVILLTVRLLLAAMEEELFGEAAVKTAKAVAELCRKNLKAMMLTILASNLVQVVFASKLLNTSFSVDLPLFSIAAAAAAMLLCRCFAESHRLQKDNDMII